MLSKTKQKTASKNTLKTLDYKSWTTEANVSFGFPRLMVLKGKTRIWRIFWELVFCIRMLLEKWFKNMSKTRQKMSEKSCPKSG